MGRIYVPDTAHLSAQREYEELGRQIKELSTRAILLLEASCEEGAALFIEVLIRRNELVDARNSIELDRLFELYAG